MDAAAAAAMSDPERNRYFSRRWHCDHEATSQRPAPDGCEEKLAGLELLEQWRRKRDALWVRDAHSHSGPDIRG
jgi:hypothetical protein